MSIKVQREKPKAESAILKSDVQNKIQNSMISYSEAFELAQAGFPQPEIEVGQMWYNHGADLCWIAKDGTPNTLPCARITGK